VFADTVVNGNPELLFFLDGSNILNFFKYDAIFALNLGFKGEIIRSYTDLLVFFVFFLLWYLRLNPGPGAC
jgi:hypothetical protein